MSAAAKLQPGDRLVADANTGWVQHEAIRVAKAVRDVDVYIEQPCLTYEECLAVRRQIPHPFVLDGSLAVAQLQKDDLIYAISPGGFKRWDFRTGGDVESSPAIGEDGTIYIGSDDRKLYALGPDGVMHWALTTVGDIRASADALYVKPAI